MSPELHATLITYASRRLIEHVGELTELDRAIGDGDHGFNMQRGAEAVLSELPMLAGARLPDALHVIGRKMLMSVGGASGPLYATLMMTLGDKLSARPTLAELRDALTAAVEAVARRGKACPGHKTLLDVLYAVEQHVRFSDMPTTDSVRDVAHEAAILTIGMKAQRGRASFLKERSIGHMDPGARSASLLVEAVCHVLMRSGKCPG
jgi:dihydroxyacetone kinase-like protein